jgi:hypothetical protein
MCRALVDVDDIDVVGVIGWTFPMQVHIASTTPRPLDGCPHLASSTAPSHPPTTVNTAWLTRTRSVSECVRVL